MTGRLLLAISFVVAASVSCSKGEKAEATDSSASVQSAPPAAPGGPITPAPGKKVIVVELTSDAKGNYLMDATDYPPEYIPVSLEHKEAYLYLKQSGLDWTFVCAPNIVNGAADNQFVTLSEAATDKWEVSAGNLALFMVEELERKQYLQKRVGISNS